MTEKGREAALAYHAASPAGKIAIQPTKPCDTQGDLALAYTPGVAEPVRAIAASPEDAYRYTAKGNLVAVVSDGTAVLGLGNVGPLASKPVLEGKAVLFKRFADIDVFDLEIKAPSAEQFIEVVAALEPTFGGINLEDIAAPACFAIEKALSERLSIPVFHDDQHGTAVIVCAGLLNALELQGKSLKTARIVCLGAGAAGLTSLRLLMSLGAAVENMILVDSRGVVHSERTDLNNYKQPFAHTTPLRTLAEAMNDADVFIGVAAADLVDAQMIRAMAPRPVVFALANPVPEILPEVAHAARGDLVMATGRSDYPNQVNNVLGFPFIFRGALDVRARQINQAMQLGAVHALSALAKQPIPREVLRAYGLDHLEFGPDYFIPKPLDARLREWVPAAVAAAAIDTGVAQAPYPAHYPPRPAPSA
ncbi:malate dehydrogenase [Acidiferrobacter sp. SPIII_3]|jgi:malate dehydrogenase (oxaloacetate-decarboxylating)(NADP+)|uniref:malic enzyme-like NAD(P)-binding protein n=1 Tax=Acidiferrobacter sp. SPIII_3 TaxID=1281578 RepID=UPI000D73CD36|nr:malic enzyme-like NAD(P)-binding protein [Acidiferrobacter sp. SPIII_3]AWP24764.1 malate dehydrogenase [Acidiferrobacter sp. SPIII_3]